MSYKNIENKTFYYKINLKSFKLTVRKITEFIQDRLEKRVQCFPYNFTFIETVEHKVESWNTGQTRIMRGTIGQPRARRVTELNSVGRVEFRQA